MRHFSIALAAAAAALACSQTVFAADLALKAPPPVAVASGNWYVWVDGMYESVALPSYSLGIHNIDPASVVDLGPAQRFNQRLDGGGVRGALGYALPGAGVRVEIGGFYVSAKSSSSQSTALPADAAPVLLSGANPGGAVFGAFLCGGIGGFTCTTAGTLSANYDAWQINGKFAFDRKFGSATVSPFVAVFGGSAQSNDTLSQAFTQVFGGAPNFTGSYSASTALHWTDAGGRAGLDVSVPVTGALTFAVGGWLGGASRTVSLSGSDVGHFSLAGFNGASTISAGDSKAVLLANAEAGLAYALSPTLNLRGFGGVNYDGSVPGVAASSFSGTAGAPTPRPAGIGYAAETSYYAGGGVEAHF